MEFKLLFVFITLCISLCNAAVVRLANATNSEFPEKCWDPSTKKPYEVNEEYFLENQCIRGICSEGFTIQYHTCSPVYAEGCTKIDGDLSLPYPKCCDQFDCTKKLDDKPITLTL